MEFRKNLSLKGGGIYIINYTYIDKTGTSPSKGRGGSLSLDGYSKLLPESFIIAFYYLVYAIFGILLV